MNLNIPLYSENVSSVRNFYNYFKLGVKEDIGDHPKNHLESIGDVGLWMIEKFPRKFWNFVKNPKVVTVALTALSLLATSYLFYPRNTILVVKAAIEKLPEIPAWSIRFSAYIFTVNAILSTACRAYGRFANDELMATFEQRRRPAAAAP